MRGRQKELYREVAKTYRGRSEAGFLGPSSWGFAVGARAPVHNTLRGSRILSVRRKRSAWALDRLQTARCPHRERENSKTPRNCSATSPLAEVSSPRGSAGSRAARHYPLLTAPPSCSVRCQGPDDPVPTPPARSESGKTKVPAGGEAGGRFDCATLGSDAPLSFRSAGL